MVGERWQRLAAGFLSNPVADERMKILAISLSLLSLPETDSPHGKANGDASEHLSDAEDWPDSHVASMIRGPFELHWRVERESTGPLV